MSKIETIQTGWTLVSSGVPDKASHKFKLAYTGLFQRRSKRIKIPVKCFYVEVKGHRFLVDAGWSKLDACKGRKHIGFKLFFASEPVLKLEESAVYQLEKKGINPEDLDGILMTHLDIDHLSGLDDFKGVKRIICSNEEYDYALKEKTRYGKLIQKHSYSFIKWEKDNSAPFFLSSDIFNDNSVIAYLTPTHSQGSVIYKINGEKGYVLLVGDNAYNEDSYKKGKIPGVLYSEDNMRVSLSFLHQQSLKRDCLGILCAHDPKTISEIDF